MNALRQKIDDVIELDRHCVLLFDEMSIKPRLLYDVAQDRVIGYQDYGKEIPCLSDTPKVATKALVFMIRGLNRNWKQPIAHYFTEKGITSEELALLIPIIIKAVNATGLKVRGVIADQASTNSSGLNLLISGTKTMNKKSYPYFFVGEEIKNKVFVIFDWPHMVKCFRNNWLGDFKTWQTDNPGVDRLNYPGNIVYWGGNIICGYWRHLTILFSLHRAEKDTVITEKMMFPLSKTKMRVCYAVKLLSNTIANAFDSTQFRIYFQRFLKVLPFDSGLRDYSGTKKIIFHMNRLFDYVNGPSDSEIAPPPTRRNVTTETDHIQVWDEYREVLEKTEIKSPDGKKIKERCINNMVRSLLAMKLLWEELLEDGFTTLFLRRLNQDPLENLFGLIRQLCGANDNPTAGMFQSALKSVVITRFSGLSIKGTNCLKDSSNFLIDQKDLIRFQHKKKTNTLPEPESIPSKSKHYPCIHIPDYESGTDDEMNEFLGEQADKTSESNMFFLSKFFRRMSFECDDCKKAFINLEENENYCEPTDELRHIVKRSINIFNDAVVPNLHHPDLGLQTSCKLKDNLKMDWVKCIDHHEIIKNKCIGLLTRLLIERECGRRNMEYVVAHARATNAQKIAQQAFIKN